MDPEETSSLGESANPLQADNSARVLLWAKQHGPLAAIALYVLYDGGLFLNLIGSIC